MFRLIDVHPLALAAMIAVSMIVTVTVRRLLPQSMDFLLMFWVVAACMGFAALHAQGQRDRECGMQGEEA